MRLLSTEQKYDYLDSSSNNKAPHNMLIRHQMQQRNHRKRNLQRLHHIQPLIQVIKHLLRPVKHHRHRHRRHDRAAPRDHRPQPLVNRQVKKPPHDELPGVGARDRAALPGCQQPDPPYVEDRERPAPVPPLQILPGVHQPQVARHGRAVEPLREHGRHEEVDQEGDEDGRHRLDGVVVEGLLDSPSLL